MLYKTHYESPLGDLLLTADAQALTGVWFDGQKYYAQGQADLEPEAGAAICNAPCEEELAPLLAEAKRWLDLYFAGKEPDFDLPLNPAGTDFQKSVWSILCTIPYGKTMTYGQIAAQIAAERGIARMSAQAVGGAVGHNPLSIIVPCHRVVGTNGQSDRIRRRHRPQDQTAHAGGHRYERLFRAEKGDGTVNAVLSAIKNVMLPVIMKYGTI